MECRPEGFAAAISRLRTIVGCACFALLALTWSTEPAHAAARSSGLRLDPSFGTAGWTKTPPRTGGEGRLVDLSLSPDGGPVVADLEAGQIVRMRPDGSLERRFGHRGLLSLGPSTLGGGKPGSYFIPNSIAVDRAGRVVVFGEQTDPARSFEIPAIPRTIHSSFAIVLRFDRRGRRDPSFGGGKGYVRDDFGLVSPLSSEVPLVGAMKGVVDSRSRPVLLAGVLSMAGACIHSTGVEEIPKAVVRLTSTGAPDPTFGSGGVSVIEGTTSYPQQLQMAGDGQLAVGAGPSGSGAARCRNGDVIYRLGPDGKRSAEFGTEGALTLARMRLAALEPSGAVIAGRRRSRTLLLGRFSPTGRRDPGFGRAGIARIHLPGGPGLRIGSVLVAKSGAIVVVGFSRGRPSRKEPASFLLARLAADGRIDPSLGVHGWLRTKFPPPLELTSVQGKLDSRGRVVVAGTTATPGNPDGGFLVARYLVRPR